MSDAILDTPVGLISIATAPQGISRLDFLDELPEGESLTACPDGLALEVQHQLTEYFEGSRADFDLPLHFDTGSPFQRRVWQAIANIPFGATMSYGELAYVAGNPGAARAVGSACGQNPIVLLVPCHRVIASDGGIGGFGSGLHRKIWLLRHEGVLNQIKGYKNDAMPRQAVSLYR